MAGDQGPEEVHVGSVCGATYAGISEVMHQNLNWKSIDRISSIVAR